MFLYKYLAKRLFTNNSLIQVIVESFIKFYLSRNLWEIIVSDDIHPKAKQAHVFRQNLHVILAKILYI